MLKRLQQTFSIPSLFLMCAHLTNTFITVAFMFLQPENDTSAMKSSELTFVVVNSLLLLGVTMAFAAQIPLDMNAFHYALQKLAERIMFDGLSNGSMANDVFLLLELRNKPIFHLSGGEMIRFTRKAILSVTGSLLTYGILILQMNSS